MTWRRVAIVVMCAGLLGSCDPGTSDPSSSAAVPTSAASTLPSRARVEINHPADGDTIRSADVLVTLTIRSFKIVDRVGRKPRAGEGHLIFYLDANPPTRDGKSALVSRARSRRVVGTSFTWRGVEPGPHALAVQLVGSDDTPLDRPAVDRITMTVRQPAGD